MQLIAGVVEAALEKTGFWWRLVTCSIASVAAHWIHGPWIALFVHHQSEV